MTSNAIPHCSCLSVSLFNNTGLTVILFFNTIVAGLLDILMFLSIILHIDRQCSVQSPFSFSNHCVGGPGVAAMMSTGMHTFFQSGVQKNLKSLYRSFVPQKFASPYVCVQTGIAGKTSFLFEVSKPGCTVWLNHYVQRAP